MKSSRYVTSPGGEVTQRLRQLSTGNREAEIKLVPVGYEKLCRLAARDMRLGCSLKLIGQRRVRWQNLGAFLREGARLMRHVLVDHARQVRASKRGGGRKVPSNRSLADSSEEEIARDAGNLDNFALGKLTGNIWLSKTKPRSESWLSLVSQTVPSQR